MASNLSSRDSKYETVSSRTSIIEVVITTAYCYDGDQVIAEYEDGTLKRKFIYGPGIDEPVIMIVKDAPDQYYFYHGACPGHRPRAEGEKDGTILKG